MCQMNPEIEDRAGQSMSSLLRVADGSMGIIEVEKSPFKISAKRLRIDENGKKGI